MESQIRYCMAPDRNPRKPNFTLPAGSIDTHVHVFDHTRYPMSPTRGYNPPDSTLDDLKHLHATLGIDRVVFTQPVINLLAFAAASHQIGLFKKMQMM